MPKASDERETPQGFFDKLNEEFHFTIDVAAKKWLKKATVEFEMNPQCELIVMLLPADPSTKWFERWVEMPGRTIRWVRPRLKFSTPDGPYKAGAKQPSMLVIFGDSKERRKC